MKTFLLILIAVISAILSGILFLLWLKKRFETKTTTTGESKKEWAVWLNKVKPLATDLFVATILILVFTEQVKAFMEGYPKIAVALILSFFVISLTGPYNPKIRRKIGILCLIVFLVFGIFWPAATEKFPKTKGFKLFAAAFQATTPEESQLPANAKFVKTLAPGEKVYLTRTNMDAPPPERWSKDATGKVTIVRPWPVGEKARSYWNDLPDTDSLYLVLPPGLTMADFKISATNPAINKQAARTPTSNTDCPLDKQFGPKK